MRDGAGCVPAISNRASQSKRESAECGGHGDIFLEKRKKDDTRE